MNINLSYSSQSTELTNKRIRVHYSGEDSYAGFSDSVNTYGMIYMYDMYLTITVPSSDQPVH